MVKNNYLNMGISDVPNVYKFSDLPEVRGYVDIMPQSEQGIILKR